MSSFKRRKKTYLLLWWLPESWRGLGPGLEMVKLTLIFISEIFAERLIWNGSALWDAKERELMYTRLKDLVYIFQQRANSELTFWSTRIDWFFEVFCRFNPQNKFPLFFSRISPQKRTAKKIPREWKVLFLQIDNGQEKGGLVWGMEKGQY